MGWPSEKELARVRRKLRNVEPTQFLPPNASKSDKFKFDLCAQFVRHLLAHKMSQRQLARDLGIDPSRMNEIVKYRIDLFTSDRLLEYAERLNPKLKVQVK